MTEEFERPTYTKEEIERATKTVLSYIEGSGKDGFFPSDVAKALDEEFWLVQDVFNVLAEQGVLQQPEFPETPGTLMIEGHVDYDDDPAMREFFMDTKDGTIWFELPGETMEKFRGKKVLLLLSIQEQASNTKQKIE
jgi:hypothetical protein